jgi:predicted HTH domain antitoxin
MATIEVPEQLLKVFAGSGPADRDVVLSAVIELIREGRISLGRGAEVLGLSRSQLIDELGRRKVPVLTLEEDGP